MDPSSPSATPASSKLDVDAIIGGVIGGTALLVLALLAASYLHRKYKTLLSTERVSDYYRSRGVINDDDDLKSPGYIEPFMLMSPLSAAAAAATSPATGTASRTPHQGLRPPSPKKTSPPRVSIPFLEIRNGAPAPQASDIAVLSNMSTSPPSLSSHFHPSFSSSPSSLCAEGRLGVPDRIYQARGGTVSLTASTLTARSRHSSTHVSVNAPSTIATAATCGY